MYQCLSGVLPFDEDNPLTIMMMHLQQLPDPFIIRRPSVEIPSGVEQIVVNCMHKDPDERYGSALAMKEAIDAQLEVIEERFSTVQFRTDEEISKLDTSQSVTRKGVPISPTARSLPEDQVAGTSHRPFWKWGVVFGLILLLGGSLAGFVYLAKGTGPAPGKSKLLTWNTLMASMVDSSPASASRVQIRSTPAGADVRVDGQKVGVTPLTLARNPGDSVALVISAEGYDPTSGTEDFSSNKTRDFSLVKKAPQPKAVVAPPTRTKTKVKAGPKKPVKPVKKAPKYRPSRLQDFKRVQ